MVGIILTWSVVLVCDAFSLVGCVKRHHNYCRRNDKNTLIFLIGGMALTIIGYLVVNFNPNLIQLGMLISGWYMAVLVQFTDVIYRNLVVVKQLP